MSADRAAALFALAIVALLFVLVYCGLGVR